MPKTSEVYSHLYHYTDEVGLAGVLDSQSLWATNIRHLNDYTELVLFNEIGPRLILPEILSVYTKLYDSKADMRQLIEFDGGLQLISERDAETFVRVMYGATGTNFFVTSFCGETQDEYINENGLLSQWRGYGQKQGFMIVLDTKELENLLERESPKFGYDNMHLSDVVYSDDDQRLREELSHSIDAIGSYTRSLFESPILKTPVIDGGDAMSGFVQCITRYKHRAFKEENEVRIAAWVRDEAMQKRIEADGGKIRPVKPVKFRGKKPYVELFGAPEFTLPIKKIVVGPHSDKQKVADAWRDALANKEIEVTVSDIPYI